ncbi:MAG TPA: ATP-binding protein [Candidatus Limnocylindrales bacterium]|nr:ATP-binding protein [Candidatus Limnocylindrales bacterium]
MPTPSWVLAIEDVSQVGQARRLATRLAEQAGFPEEQCGQAALVATELSTNLLKYGTQGKLMLQPADWNGDALLQVLAIDHGPGIADVQRCLQDGVSTGGTPGTGLGAVQRLSQVFDIHSTVGKGTVVFAACGRRPARPRKASSFTWTALSTPAPGETVCGDTWAVRETDGGLDVMVADGLGHGPLAFEAAEMAARAFEARPATTVEYLERAHRALQGSRGAALAMARVDPSGAVAYAGLGNISGTIAVDGKGRGLASQNGTVGLQARRLQQHTYELPANALLTMHSDGLSNRWSLDNYVGLATRHPAVIAGVLYRDMLRGRDDATIVVIRRGTLA